MNVDAINRKLLQDEEWLRNFEKNVKRSSHLREGIEEILDNFGRRLQNLQENVMPMHEANGQLQVKQQNIQKLIKAIDTTIQFYGRTSELESKIRDGLPSHDIEGYIDSMESLQQAVNFFEDQPERRLQLENMRMTLETGFSVLEREFRTVVTDNSLVAEPRAVVESLDEQAELLPGRCKTIVTVKNAEKISRLGDWLIKKDRGTRFLSHYTQIRGENMQKTLSAIINLQSTVRTPQKEKVAKPVVSRIGNVPLVNVQDPADAALTLFACFLVLVTIEESVLEKTIADVAVRAQVHRELVSRPLQFTVKQVERSVHNSEGVTSLLPLLTYLTNHYNQLHTLALNSSVDVPFESMLRQTRVKCSTYINEFVERLKTDPSKFVPEDGNVHPVTASTMKLLCLLTAHRQTVTHQILSTTSQSPHNASLLLPKLFARVLSALGSSLQRKSEDYDDPNLKNLFMLNNYNYIARGLQDEEDALLPVISEQNTQILEFYLSQIQLFESNYLASWSPLVTILTSLDGISPEDKQTFKAYLSNFNRDFETTCTSHKNYCISDPGKADEVRSKVKSRLIPKYVRLVERVGGADSEAGLVMKHTEETLENHIDRLFDATA